MARTFRLWGKKRGDRRTGSQLLAGVWEAFFFGTLFLLGSVSLTYLITSQVVDGAPRLFHPGFGYWLMVLSMVSFTLIGGGGVIYTVLHVGTSAERRSAMAKRAANLDLTGDAASSPRDYPSVPRDANLTNSPGIRLAYRLPVTHAGAWVLSAASAFFLVWNGITAVLVAIVVKGHLARAPDWFLTFFVLPFVVIGIWATYYFLKQMLLHTGIGPTNVEISDHPLRPGRKYQLFLSQAGRLQVHWLELSLVCEEETTYRQGTDIRSERCRVFCDRVFMEEDVKIEPGRAFERETELLVPHRVMHSFQAKHNAILWMLVVRGHARSWPVFERSFPIVVYPPPTESGDDLWSP
ncbi:MAG: ABC transporter ATP-binding protein [Planctomycetes bacterium]|nr:ABC transporter ATP-binding protein [Planctomycetota bacterium]